MARRSKDEDVVVAIGKLIGLGLVLGMVFPQTRQLISGLGSLVFGLVIFVAVLLVVFVIYRIIIRSLVKPDYLNNELPSTPHQPAPPPFVPLNERLKQLDWFQFEKVIEAVYQKLGYQVIRKGGANPDGGIDLIIEKDDERTAIQCKQWKTWNVGVKVIREFLGALTDAGMKKGMVITLCGYTEEAKNLADRHGIQIRSETDVLQLLETACANHDPAILSIFNDTRKICPKCESEMVLRTSRKGLNVGSQFWGCSKYPKCRFTMTVT